jgi:hypothetical protein
MVFQMKQMRSIDVRRALDRPVRVGAERMIHEEVPSAVRASSVHLHAAMVHLDRVAVLVLAGDQPLKRERP